jgi:hypothetical protein
MNRGNATNQPPSSKKLLVSATICAALAFGLGYVFACEWYGFAQPALMALTVPAGVFGFLARRAFAGVVAAPLFGYVGAAGLILRFTWGEGYPLSLDDILMVLGVEGSLGGLICMVAGAVGGFVGQRAKHASGSHGCDHRTTGPDTETSHIGSQDEKGAC